MSSRFNNSFIERVTGAGESKMKPDPVITYSGHSDIKEDEFSFGESFGDSENFVRGSESDSSFEEFLNIINELALIKDGFAGIEEGILEDSEEDLLEKIVIRKIEDVNVIIGSYDSKEQELCDNIVEPADLSLGRVFQAAIMNPEEVVVSKSDEADKKDEMKDFIKQYKRFSSTFGHSDKGFLEATEALERILEEEKAERMVQVKENHRAKFLGILNSRMTDFYQGLINYCKED